jgi:mono/diheme cytochrome c family protein
MLLGLAACRMSTARESRDFERMRRQQRYDAYDTSGFFADGKVLQAPPANTMARGPAFSLAVESIANDTAAGAAQYVISCAPCHGAGGFGGGPIAPNLTEKRPPSLRTDHVTKMATEGVVAVITDGLGQMPPLGWQLRPEARTAVADYVHSLNGLPVTAAARVDSTLAAYLHRLDSLAGAGAGLDAVLRLRGSVR